MTQTSPSPAPVAPSIRVMIVDDAPENLLLLQDMLIQHGCDVVAFSNGAQALKAAKLEPPDLILLDITMPEMDGYQVCETLRAHPRLANTPVIFLSALGSTEDKVRAFQAGGVDYITKPFQFEEVQARIATHFRLHELQLRLEFQNRHLQQLVEEKAQQLSESQLATIFALAKLADSRSGDVSFRLDRIRLYCKLIADTLRLGSPYADEIDLEFVTLIQHAAPLHDIGEVAIPDTVLQKPGKLTPDEWQIMQTHAEVGERTLSSIATQHQGNAFLRMGIEIAGGHHERWDGTGYPRGLAGTDIPLSARIMALVDAYVALRSTRSYRAEVTHAEAVATIKAAAGSQLDPIVVAAFVELEKQFDRIHNGV